MDSQTTSTKKQILLVEDSPVQLEMLRRLLVKEGYDVVLATNGAEGLEKAREHNPALIVSDISMPIMNGYEMCGELKKDPALKNISVMLLTSLADLYDLLRGLEAGANYYVTKPFNEKYLLSKLHTVLQEGGLPMPRKETDGLVIYIGGERRTVSSDIERMWSLLTSTYENAIEQNRELVKTQVALKALTEKLEMKVDKRTEQLRKTIEELQKERDALKKAHMGLVRSEKLASIGTLSAGVAHEILNPLNIISTIVQVLQLEELPAEFRENLDDIMAQVHRATKITNNLRMFAHQEKNSTGPVDVHKVFDKTASLIEPDLKLDNILIKREFDDNLPAIYADEDKLTQVFINLLNNARDVLVERHSGLIVIKTESVQGGIKIIFSDNGPGMPKNIADKIFDPFFTTKDPGQGTGLGLSIVHSIIENHNGSIELRSREGEGTMFVITLPVGKSNE